MSGRLRLPVYQGPLSLGLASYWSNMGQAGLKERTHRIQAIKMVLKFFIQLAS